MRIELERGLITKDDEAVIQTVAKIPIEFLQEIGDDESLGTLLMEFIHKMTTTSETEGILINKNLIDMLVKDYNKEDNFLIGFNVKDKIEPQLVVLKTDGSMDLIEKVVE